MTLVNYNGFKFYNGVIKIYIDIYYTTLFSMLQWKGCNFQECAWPHIRSVTGYGINYVNPRYTNGVP